jgi:hypothetical protein
MTRNDFIRKVIQIGLFAALSLVVIALKNRIITDGNCSACPENGRCPGKNDCIKN